MSPARRRLGAVRAVAERLLRGAPRRSAAEQLAEAVQDALPEVRALALELAAVTAPEAQADGDEDAVEPWLEPDQAGDAPVLARVVVLVDRALVSVDETVGYAVPGPRLASALGALGWTPETGLDGPVRDDVDAVTLYPPDEASPTAHRTLWDSAVTVAREALVAGQAPGSVLPVALGA